ncbi:MAG: hypothetical protein HY042_03000 [Spirochaetia bacterium]|nr:hypothetical protein [Spirochaetia bacterium]
MERRLKDPGALTPEEQEYVKNSLAGLISTLKAKKLVHATGTSLISDEDIVLNSLLHPERGDVVVSLLRGHKRPELFISNRREEGSPFAVMTRKECDRHPGRRMINGSIESLKDEMRGLFLTTVQDRDLLEHSTEDKRIDIFSVHFGMGEAKETVLSADEILRRKKLEECTIDDKWNIYMKQWDADYRIPLIEKELFTFKVSYAKYKQAPKEEVFHLTPEKAKQLMAQFIRDMYPYGVRTTLRQNYPVEHKAKLQEVYESAQRFSLVLKKRMGTDNAALYNAFLEQMCNMLDSIQVKDPELSGFV